jgi:hypothetical protein
MLALPRFAPIALPILAAVAANFGLWSRAIYRGSSFNLENVHFALFGAQPLIGLGFLLGFALLAADVEVPKLRPLWNWLLFLFIFAAVVLGFKLGQMLDF